MAIEIIPKKAEAKTLTLINILFYFSLILLIIILLSSLLLFLFQKSFNNTLQDVKINIAAIGTPEEMVLEGRIFSIQKKINNFAALLDLRQSNLKFFTNLEKITHPKIFFSKVSLQIKEGRISLSGAAENFEALGQQLLIFKKEDYIGSVSLSKASMGENGKIEFVFGLSFAAEKFKY